jgi:hypothetical protein
MRLGREAALIALTLLASTESASAESAWLLWLTPIADNRHATVMLAELNLMYPTGGLLEVRCLLDSVELWRPSQGNDDL